MSQADRTVSLLSRLSGGTSIKDLFSGNRITVSLESGIAGNPQAQLTFSFTVNLLARLHPVLQKVNVVLPKAVTVTAPLARWEAPTLGEHIQKLLKALDPPIHWTVEEREQLLGDGIELVVESPAFPLKKHHLFLASNGWEAAVSVVQPLIFGSQVNAIGAFATACFGASETWKVLLYPHRDLFPGVPIFPLQNELTFSTFTYRADRNEPNPPLPEVIGVKRLTLIGLGAGGGAGAFTLGSLPSLMGTITVVEPDEIIDHNLNRYVFADSHDARIKRSKTGVITQILSRHSGLRIVQYPKPYDEVEGDLSTDDYQYVVTAVHTREARRGLQYETPKVLWDAGATELGDFKIWRLILGETECMLCKHPFDEGDPELEKAQQLSNLLGLDAATWRRKLRNNEAFTEYDLSMITRHINDNSIQFDLPVTGERYGDWYGAQCGNLQLPDTDDEIPIPFAPIMAGVLLAGEVVKEHYYPGDVLNSSYWNTLLGKFMRRKLPTRRLPRADCSFCSDAVYLAQYDRQWRNR